MAGGSDPDGPADGLELARAEPLDERRRIRAAAAGQRRAHFLGAAPIDVVQFQPLDDSFQLVAAQLSENGGS